MSSEVNADAADPNLIRQWVSEVLAFSSQYNDNTWSANSVIGTPRVYPNYGDLHNAWAQSSDHFTQNEFIELKYPEEVYATEMHIYETYNSGAIVRIKLKNSTSEEWVQVWHSENEVPVNIGQSRIFSPQLEQTNFKTCQVRLELDCTLANSYCEIDAIELVGKKFLVDIVESEKSLSNDLKNLLISEEFSDVEFQVEGKILKGHRNIITARCSYLKSLLCENLRPDRLAQPIYLDNITYDGLKSLLYYFYTDSIEDTTQPEIVCELMRISKWYNLDKLDQVGYLFLKDKLCLDNVIPIYVCAIKKEPLLDDVEKMCLKFIVKNFNLVLNKPEFKSLDKDKLVKITQFYSQFLKK